MIWWCLECLLNGDMLVFCAGPCRTRFGVLSMALKAAKHQAFYISNTWYEVGLRIKNKINHEST